MLILKHLLILTLLNTGLLMASTLQTSDNLNNLEIITDTDCERKNVATMTQSSQSEEQVRSKMQEVETVSYTLNGCNGVASFPVTVRSYKRQGEMR